MSIVVKVPPAARALRRGTGIFLCACVCVEAIRALPKRGFPKKMQKVGVRVQRGRRNSGGMVPCLAYPRSAPDERDGVITGSTLKRDVDGLAKIKIFRTCRMECSTESKESEGQLLVCWLQLLFGVWCGRPPPQFWMCALSQRAKRFLHMATQNIYSMPV